MNQFTKKTKPSKDGAGTGRKESPWVAGLIFKMGLIMFIIFAAFFARVHLNDKTEQLAREKSRISAQIEEKNTEIQALNIQIANLQRWDNINAKIRQYKLALHAANPNQVFYVKRYTGQTEFEMPTHFGSDTRVADAAGAQQQPAERIH
jgi:cell division protein FtsL